MLELLAIEPIRRAALALLVSGLAFPLIGYLILALEMVPARFAIMHIALLGASLALGLGWNPSLCALGFSLIGGLSISALSPRGRGSASGPLALIMVASLALAFLIFQKLKINSVEALGLFWGSLLSLSQAELVFTLIFCLGILSLFALGFTPIKLILCNRDLAEASGLPSRLIYSAMMAAICLALALAMRISGALMADASTILPALAAGKLGLGYRRGIVAASLVGVSIHCVGFFLALWLDLPLGPAIALCGVVAVILCHAIRPRARIGNR